MSVQTDNASTACYLTACLARAETTRCSTHTTNKHRCNKRDCSTGAMPQSSTFTYCIHFSTQYCCYALVILRGTSTKVLTAMQCCAYCHRRQQHYYCQQHCLRCQCCHCHALLLTQHGSPQRQCCQHSAELLQFYC
jgi:hypothetical protein